MDLSYQTESVALNIFAKLFKKRTKLYLEENVSGDLKLWTLTGEVLYFEQG